MTSSSTLLNRVICHLDSIYEDVELTVSIEELAKSLIDKMRIFEFESSPEPFQNHWDQQDVVLITYGDSILSDDQLPLHNLHHFLTHHCGDSINSVHILPFFPYSSDQGFAVINFAEVNQTLGEWRDIRAIAQDHRLMADLVINHCSSRSLWFENFKQGKSPGKDYFVSVPAETNTELVVRPRTSPLLRETETAEGTKHVWCTFSHDQIDLNFANPEVLEEFVSIIRLYLDNGVRLFRLDAVAFLWKELGTPCINLPQTHEVIRLLRTLIEHAQHDAVIITETNIPNRENLTYFGNANEAHCIYNFSLPPLLVNTLVSGDCSALTRWMMSMPPAQNGTAYFNFIASHDGLGLRPAEGLLEEEKITQLIDTMEKFGGRISWRAKAGSKPSPYEINISLFDALQGTYEGPDKFGQQRFICAHAIMLALEGIPGIYIHSLLGTQNDTERMQHTGHNRAINRHQWHYPDLETALSDQNRHHSQVFKSLKALIEVRKQQSAFHPNATQFTLHLGETMFGFWRQSIDRRQSIFCIYNVSNQPQELRLSSINLISTDNWRDLLSENQIESTEGNLVMEPYQALWITNS